MEAVKKLGLLAIAIMLCTALGACGGGSEDTTDDPTLPDPAPTQGGGDFDTPRILGAPQTPFAPLGGQPFNDLRGVAVSSRFVYIADSTSISLYRTNGQGIMRVPSPYGATIQGIAIFPESIDVDMPDNVDPLSPFAGLPVVLHNPVPQQGYITILPPNLDNNSTIEDGGNLDLTRLVTLPNGGISPPLDPTCPVHILNEAVDIKVDPFGSILVTTKVILDDCETVSDAHGHQNPIQWHVGLQILNRFNDYALEFYNTWPTAHRAFDHSVGFLGGFAIGDHILAIPGTDLGQYEYQIFTGDVFSEGDIFFSGGGNFLDFVGRSRMRLNLNTLPPTYVPNPIGNEPPYYDQLFGNMFGETFAPFPNGDDPDLTNGGPSGMFVSDIDGSLYICDPGNDRIMVYDGFKVDPLLPTLIGDTQILKQIITDAAEPSEVVVDEFGRTFICDFNDLRTLPGQTLNTLYGNIGGTVRHIDLDVPIVGATVAIQDEFGIIALTNTNINGDYLFTNAPYGQYMMTASKFGYGDDSFVATITPDDTIRVDFNLEPREPILTGGYLGVVFDDTTRSFLSDVFVSVVGTSISSQTDGNGEFKISNLAAGTYQVIFTKDGYETRSMDVVIASGETAFHPSIVMKRLPLF